MLRRLARWMNDPKIVLVVQWITVGLMLVTLVFNLLVFLERR